MAHRRSSGGMWEGSRYASNPRESGGRVVIEGLHRLEIG